MTRVRKSHGPKGARNVCELFSVGWGAEGARSSQWVGKKNSVGTGRGYKRKEKSLTPERTLHLIKSFLPPWVTFNPLRALSGQPHFTQRETEDQQLKGAIARSHRDSGT